MKTSELLNTINETENSLEFMLPSGETIKGDLHITEIKNVTVDSTDCGGFKHSFQETVIQLWLNESSKKDAKWTTSKASKIFEIVGNQRDFLVDAEAFFEFGDSNHLTSKYSITPERHDDGLILHLGAIYPQCKPRLLQQTSCC